MLLVHATNPKYIKGILADGALKSFKQTGKVGEGEGSNDMNPNAVFLSVLFDFYKILIPGPATKNHAPVWLIFDTDKTLKSKHPEHFCPAWDWGKYEEECVQYSSTTTPADWEAAYRKRWSASQQPNRYLFGLPSADFAVNELVFKDSVNLDENLVGIYALDAKWKHPLLMTKPQELMDFLSNYGYKSIEIHDWPAGLPRNDDMKFYKKYMRKSRRRGTKSRKTLKKSKSRS